MGWVGRLLSFVRVQRNGANVSDVEVDTGGGATVTAEHFQPAGDDAFPLTTDYPTGHDVQQTGRRAVVGYVDPINTPKAAEGEKRIYARDADSGVEVAEVWLKADGTITAGNDNGSVTVSPNGSIAGSNNNGNFELEIGGDFVVNGVTISANGDVTVPNSLVLNGKEIDAHDHGINSGSSAPGPTGGNN